MFGLILVASIGTSIYFYRQYQSTKALLADPSAAAQQEVRGILSKIGTFMALPTDEEPTLATVLDTEKLKEQPFFAKSANGDKVIIYTKAGKAILYRPSANKIIEVMPISLTQPEAETTVGGEKQIPLVKPTATPQPTDQPTE